MSSPPHQREGPLGKQGGVGGDFVNGFAGVDAEVVLLDQGLAGGGERGVGDQGRSGVTGLLGEQVGQFVRAFLGQHVRALPEDGRRHDDRTDPAGERLSAMLPEPEDRGRSPIRVIHSETRLASPGPDNTGFRLEGGAT
ncbi:hypothetical protein [Streptomyces sp. NPDC093544]|uniref:hypothetical protein n=1 Tax=Streptomyces sp. NPDC093544 TaxID=3155200 RepID=UPI0034270AF4